MANHALWDESPQERFRDYSETHDAMMRLGDEHDPAFRASEHKAAMCFAVATIALILYSLGALAWQIVQWVRA